MPELTLQDLAAKLRSERFDRAASAVQTVTDPIVDTPMIVTLDELRPYELNPRIARNPKYDEIKASIRERGLDAPPAITRRFGEAHFVIRSGGNTRLAILRELWTETKEERFFHIPCLFRPWSPRGEIVALTGHLAENELHGDLSFIERALGVEKARELYEHEIGKPLSQRELARRLTADGYPISHTLVNRMQDTVRHLLPAIPTVLYGGLGRPQVERLAALRRAGSRVWEHHAQRAQPSVDFQALLQDVLASLDADPERFSTQRAQDELLRQMARLLSSDYDTLALEIIDADGAADALSRDPAGQPHLNAPFPIEGRATPSPSATASPLKSVSAPPRPQTPASRPSTQGEPERSPAAQRNSPDHDERDDDPQAHIGSPANTLEPAAYRARRRPHLYSSEAVQQWITGQVLQVLEPTTADHQEPDQHPYHRDYPEAPAQACFAKRRADEIAESDPTQIPIEQLQPRVRRDLRAGELEGKISIDTGMQMGVSSPHGQWPLVRGRKLVW